MHKLYISLLGQPMLNITTDVQNPAYRKVDN